MNRLVREVGRSRIDGFLDKLSFVDRYSRTWGFHIAKIRAWRHHTMRITYLTSAPTVLLRSAHLFKATAITILLLHPHTPVHAQIAIFHSRHITHRYKNFLRVGAWNVQLQATIWNTMDGEGLATYYARILLSLKYEVVASESTDCHGRRWGFVMLDFIHQNFVGRIGMIDYS